MRCGWGSNVVTYSADLEARALAWASTCPSAQNPYDPTATDGENVFLLNPGSQPPYTGDVVTQLWAAEASTWNCVVNGCTDPQTQCRNFRQIVWSTTTQIGCAAVNNCTGAFPVVYVCRYRPPGNIAFQHPLANPSQQCPLNGGGTCASTTSSATSTSTTTSSSSSTTTTSPVTPPPTYPPTCSAQPAKVVVVRPPQTRIRFSFDGMLDGVCDTVVQPIPVPCDGGCPQVPLTPVNIQRRAESLVL